ncbi:hypothetical protein Poli38472_008037 [Pythium oligandrum]|uniref:Rab3 GTPase-activating protein catalytic subunit n=1 Tax=Pythium oligandrum TaxID=41045 RepID=A0A8K1CLD5_PYTOL|nr:hypothetical protein Poli38472_008037 [Pythium oligandrum]|eukprot:TMW65395.1 hypothetical protein Poli38472_008037 [Pythium oligandrum]
MQVEEDPSSQFVDFTNATALEQFASDVEQTLIAWQLVSKGHAASLRASNATSTSENDAVRTFTRVLEWTQSHGKSTTTVNYAVTLFVGREEAAEAPEPAKKTRRASKTQQWQEGREHFTPTMLAVADATREMALWKTQKENLSDGWESNDMGAEIIAQNVRKWFGVEEFLFLSRTSLKSDRQRQQKAAKQRVNQPTTTGERSRREKDDFTDNSALDTRPGAFCDGSMDPHEANMVLSAVHLALNSCNCTIPAFVPVFDPARGTWLGSATPGSTGNVSIVFETDSVPEMNSNQSCISGLMDFFQTKLQLPPHIEEQCRLSSGDSENLSIGMWVSAAFHYKWRRDEDPREIEKVGADWRYVRKTSVSSIPTRVMESVFGKDHTSYWGPATSPLQSLRLVTMWPSLREGTYVDNAVHSTLDPLTAPQWILHAQFDESHTSHHARNVHDPSRKPTMHLSRLVANLVHAYSKSRELSRDTLVSELAPTIPVPSASNSSSSPSTPPASGDEATYLSGSKIRTDAIPAARAAVVLGNAIGTITSTLVSAATWKGTDIEEIRRVVSDLFDNDGGSMVTGGTYQAAVDSVPSSVKHGAPVGELVSILACRMGQLHGLHSMSLLWVEFVKSLRDRWFLQQLLPRLSTSDTTGDEHNGTEPVFDMFMQESTSSSLPRPDFHQCLLHQKLQLLNCCILRQAELSRRESAGIEAASPLRRSSVASPAKTKMADITAFSIDEDEDATVKDESPSDDEFFDSVEQDEQAPGTAISSGTTPEGVKRTIPGMFCLKTNSMMMEPVTQAAVPLTEDVAAQQQELLSRLGVTGESAMLRQQMQSAALVSDMQAFKAANPGACLADFVRWYSPKDWIPFDSSNTADLPAGGKDLWWFENKGMLSERMRTPPSSSESTTSQHLWYQMWQNSVPTPVVKQKRLFDPVGESEKLYHYLETIAPHEMFHQMLAAAISSCYVALEQSVLPFPSTRIPLIRAALGQLRTVCDRAITLLDDAFAASQVAVPVSREKKEEEQARMKGQLQVAFEMALDACWKVVQVFEECEMLASEASSLIQLLSDPDASDVSSEFLQLVNALLLTNRSGKLPTDASSSDVLILLQNEGMRNRLASLVLHNPSSRDPTQREYVLRCICPRPYYEDPLHGKHGFDGNESDAESTLLDLVDESPVVVNRMYASFTRQTVRFALTLSESEF